eukprot:Em0003g1665a
MTNPTGYPNLQKAGVPHDDWCWDTPTRIKAEGPKQSLATRICIKLQKHDADIVTAYRHNIVHFCTLGCSSGPIKHPFLTKATPNTHPPPFITKTTILIGFIHLQRYALEALRLQFQFATLQPNPVPPANWGRFVNTHGGKGRNCLGISTMSMRLALGFERQTGIHPEATDHSRKSDAKDVQIVVEVVLKARILEVIDKRCQSKFPNFSPNPPK